jgi:hypothetical protein
MASFFNSTKVHPDRSFRFTPRNEDDLRQAVRSLTPNTCSSMKDWDLLFITDLSYLFKNSKLPLVGDIFLKWNVSNVTNMEGMFLNATEMNAKMDTWDVSSVTNMSKMFEGATSFNQPLEKWGQKVFHVTDMSRMFYGASSFNQYLGTWALKNVKKKSNMFYGATAFNKPFEFFNPSSDVNPKVDLELSGGKKSKRRKNKRRKSRRSS